MAYQDLYMDQGTDFASSITLDADDGSAVNIAGYSFLSQIRTSYFTTNATANLFVNIIDSTNGIAELSLDSANTSNITAGRYVYDVKMEDTSNTTTRILQGILTVTPQASHIP
jgi:hypothetical protein